jgi:hypothetical protein
LIELQVIDVVRALTGISRHPWPGIGSATIAGRSAMKAEIYEQAG